MRLAFSVDPAKKKTVTSVEEGAEDPIVFRGFCCRSQPIILHSSLPQTNACHCAPPILATTVRSSLSLDYQSVRGHHHQSVRYRRVVQSVQLVSQFLEGSFQLVAPPVPRTCRGHTKRSFVFLFINHSVPSAVRSFLSSSSLFPSFVQL